MRQSHRPSGSPLEEFFQKFPRGLALLELSDLKDASTWRLVSINDSASGIVVPSIETFLSSAKFRLGGHVDLPSLYRQIVETRHPRMIGMIEARSASNGHGAFAVQRRLYTVLAFPAGPRQIGFLFEDAYASVSGRSARAEAERQLSQTCEFVGAILWRAEPETLKFSYVSPHAQAILGYWLERWTGETDFWKNHLVPDDRERVSAICDKIVRERRRQDFQFRMISVHGQILWFHAAAELVEQLGRTQLVGVMNDITDVKRAEERVRALSSRLMRVQDNERRRISRELHDSLGQYLTAIKINLEIVKRESTTIDERHRALMAESSETLEKCVQEVRSVSYLLHPPMLDELGLLAALRWFTASFAERSRMDVHLNAPHKFSRLSTEMELAFFRVAQESLTNVQRHSGSNAAWVTLSEDAEGIEIRIVDSGSGIRPEILEQIKQGKTIEGIGLRGMHERMRELGGRLEIQSSSMGTAVSAMVSLEATRSERSETEQRRLRKPRAVRNPAESSDVRIANVRRKEPWR